MSTTHAAPAPPALADRLRQVRVGLRQDLEFSRHVFRGRASYIIRDPVTFQSHRVGAHDYEVLMRVQPERTLGEVFAELVANEQAGAADEEAFYQFVFSMHRFGFLNLPVSDEKSLYRRNTARRQARRKQLWMAPISFRLPLWNPDRFLSRTLPVGRVLFSRVCFLLWLLLVGGAVSLAVLRWEELLQPLNGLLAAQNLPLIWLALIVLKAFHELGHAYACRHFGGHVPEIGAYLIMLTPCAYVDASAAWGFPRKRDRIIVSLAGMYVEAIFAALAVFVWSLTSPGLLNAVAYNVIFLASSVTILFNLNPLMKFDGYFVLSDWLEIPNLVGRSQAHLAAIAKRYLLGLRPERTAADARESVILAVYGIGAAAFRFSLAMAIAALIASKLFIVGITGAAMYVGFALFRTGTRVFGYLVRSQETAPVRVRAVAVGALGALLFPLALAALPVRWTVSVPGEVRAERQSVVRAATPGYLEQVHVQEGQRVEPGQPLATLLNDVSAESLHFVRAQLAAATIRRDAYRFSDPARAQQELTRIGSLRESERYQQKQVDDLVVAAPQAGKVVGNTLEHATGRYLRTGDALLTVVDGAPQVQALLDESALLAAHPQPGQRVVFRPSDGRFDDFEGVVSGLVPAGSRRVDRPALTHLAGGEVAVDEVTHESQQRYFEVTIDVRAPTEAPLMQGMTGRVQFPTQPEPLGMHLLRKLIRFYDRLRTP